MKTTGNTILITGGSAGIGFEMAKLFSGNGNKVIITGRNEARLAQAAAQLPNVTVIQSDVSDAADTDALATKLVSEFPALNIVINNAGKAHVYDLATSTGGFEKAQEEMLTNYLSVIRLNEKLLPHLKQQPDAAIVNVSSIVSFAPTVVLSSYGASKAALHSYSRALRLALQDTTVKVFELMPPLVNTEFSHEIGGSNGIPPAQVATELQAGLAANNFEIHVASTADFYQLYLSSPENALAAINNRA